MGGTKLGGSAQGGKTDVDVGTIHWDDIERLLKMDESYNRPNRQGARGITILRRKPRNGRSLIPVCKLLKIA